MANVLPREKQLLVLKMLANGSSIRATERVSNVHRDTVMRLMLRFGESCRDFMDSDLRNVETDHVELDEQWCWVGKKNKHLTEDERNSSEFGDQFLYVGLCQTSLLAVSHLVGKRNGEVTQQFVDDLAGRIVLPDSANVSWDEKPQLSTDGWSSYRGSIWNAFGSLVQHGVIIKNYENEEMGRYAPPEIVQSERRRVLGVLNLRTICTSHVERFNCTTRQFCKRFARLTLAFSKRLRNLKAAVAMHIAFHNYVWRPRVNGNSGRKRLTPIMVAELSDRLWTFEDLYDNVMG